MDCQDWTTVVLRKTPSKKSASPNPSDEYSIQSRDHERNERVRLAKIEEEDIADAPKKRVKPESIQQLIRKRIEMKLNQEKADQLCNFPKNTFKDLESNRALPTVKQQSVIQKMFGVQLRVITIPSVSAV
jgi:ribosome-binding protein aMBF1 (putative translation factor)